MPQKSGYVFENGKPITDIKHSFTSACRKAGITDFRFHDLRHTYASHMAMRGVHIRALQELLGHKTLAMTQRYSHLASEQLQNAVKLLDGVIGERREGVGQGANSRILIPPNVNLIAMFQKMSQLPQSIFASNRKTAWL